MWIFHVASTFPHPVIWRKGYGCSSVSGSLSYLSQSHFSRKYAKAKDVLVPDLPVAAWLTKSSHSTDAHGCRGITSSCCRNISLVESEHEVAGGEERVEVVPQVRTFEPNPSSRYVLRNTASEPTPAVVVTLKN